MRSDLWSKLVARCNNDWLWNLTEQSRLILDRTTESSQDLQESTKAKLQEISFVGKQSSNNKLNIVIVELDPIDFLSAFLAALIKGTNIFLCDPGWQQQEWQQVLNLVQPDFVFARRQTKDLLLNIKATATNKNALQPNLDRASLIMIPTGGSSGKIKFAMHSWSTLSASVMGFKSYFGCQKINSFCTLPLYHVSGLMQFMRSFITEGNLIIGSYKAIANKPIEFQTRDYFISLVPTQLQLSIDAVPDKLKEFKTILLGGASISRSLLNEARKHNLPLAPTYGMTETASGVVTLKPKDFLAGNNSNGRVLSHATVIIESQNSPGLINIKCASLCLGYYPKVFDNSSIFVTDDLGYFDPKGFLYIFGRNSQKIITGGENVFPAEVEAAILETKLVKDVCVIGISDRKWGQIVTAVYVPLPVKQDLDLIKNKIKLQLAKYKQPKKWIEVNKLPRNNRGKINYQKVKEIALQLTINN